MKILVTGGCGFIGSNFIKYLLTDKEVGEDVQILNLDKITYAGKGGNIEHMGFSHLGNYEFIKADIANKEIVDYIISKNNPDIIFNFAAESHVDRSIENPDIFEQSNIIGACNLFRAALANNVKKIIQVSTDEVYGSIKFGNFSEESPLNPSSPYSASKASADLMALSYYKTHNLPIIITRSANNYGPYQFPEKILPLFITNLIEGKKVPLMWSEDNPGLNIRDWLNVRDNCRAIWFVSQNGKDGEIYNIPGENERTNYEVTKILLREFGLGEDFIEKINHRKAHDFRYSIMGDKLKRLGFRYNHSDLDKGIKEIVDWYKNNANWWGHLKK